MFEWAASEFDSLMIAKKGYHKVAVDPMVVGGSQVLGVDELRYTDGRTTVVFVGSSAAMQLRITRRHRGGPEEVLVDDKFTDFGAVREAIKEHIG